MELFTILLVSVAMLFSSYAAGCLPLFFTLSEGRIRLTSVFGAGILIGTTLCVIIPEGISAYYDSGALAVHLQNIEKNHINVDWQESMNRIRTTLAGAIQENSALRRDLDSLLAATSTLSKRDALNNKSSLLVANQVAHDVAYTRVKRSENAVEYEHSHNNSAIGLSLMIGFLFLFIVDHFSKAHAAGRNKSVPTLGLIIHAAADGIAMGSASTATDSDMAVITFFAIMIHKAPAAFALASFLLLEGLEKFRIRRHLLAFSLAAPLTTIITHVLLKNTGSDSGQATGSNTGLILLFSGGTFLYIAASHVLPELESKRSSATPALVSSGTPDRQHFSVMEALLFIGAALLPSLLASHQH